MAVYKIAGVEVEYDCTYPLLKERSEKYKILSRSENAVKLTLTEEFYNKMHASFPQAELGVAEYMGMGNLFYKELLRHGGMMLHASAVALNGEAYLFSGPSGVGKSTHTALWQEHFGKENAVIINDDKPAVRKIGETYYAFGTPFSGKFDLSRNQGFPIKGICFLNRAENCSVQCLIIEQALTPLFEQTIRPSEVEKMELLCDVADDLLKSVPFYLLKCNQSIKVVEEAYNAMKIGGQNEN